MSKTNSRKSAETLNAMLVSYKAFKLSRPFNAKYEGRDAITGTTIWLCSPARMLDNHILNQVGIDVLTLASGGQRRFVDDLEGDGVYYVFNGLGKATRVEIKGERAYVFANYGKEISLAALRSQRLNHMTALVISVEPTRANWWSACSEGRTNNSACGRGRDRWITQTARERGCDTDLRGRR